MVEAAPGGGGGGVVRVTFSALLWCCTLWCRVHECEMQQAVRTYYLSHHSFPCPEPCLLGLGATSLCWAETGG
jgi:hypothetical protein